MQKGSPFLRIFRKKAAFNVLSKPHQSERCAFCAHRAQSSILKSTHFALFERKTAPRTHSPGAFRALRARNSPPHPSVADFRVRRREINFDHKSPRHARGDLFFSRRSSPSWHYDWRALSGAPIVPLPRNRLASSATGGASPVSPSWVISALRAALRRLRSETRLRA